MPPPTQELLDARIAIRETIAENRIMTDEASQRIAHWHQQIKVWQDTDSLSDAFADGRLTFRQMSHPEKKYNYAKENPTKDPTREKILGIINNDSHQKEVTNTAVKNDDDVWVLGGAKRGRILLDAGGAGIVRRMNPQNFLRTAEAPQSSKFRLGLHALSASLLDPAGYVLKRYEESVLIVLMPLPFPEDVRLFYQLRELSKTGGCASFQNAVVVMASEFTRPQFASSLDMGAQYVVVKSERTGKDSVKYVRGTKNKDVDGQTPTECRNHARNNYKAILGNQTANEITIAYRRCGNLARFPVFAVSTPKVTDYTEVSITLPGPPRVQRYGTPPPVGNPNYAPTGFIISGNDFSKRPG